MQDIHHSTKTAEVSLADYAPAALATEPHPRVSATYSFLPTSTVVNALRSDGWLVADAKQTNVRAKQAEHVMSRKHELMLAHRDTLATGYSFRTETPRIILTNAHDGGAAFKLRAGLFVKACLNGLYVPDGLVQSVSIRHSRHTIEEVVAAAQALRGAAEKVREHVEVFRAKQLTYAEREEFARAAIVLRHGEQFRTIHTSDVLAVKREADAGDSLWKVFNRVQEHLIKGGYPVLTDLTSRRARGIKAIDQVTKINLKLWNLAEQFSLN